MQFYLRISFLLLNGSFSALNFALLCVLLAIYVRKYRKYKNLPSSAHSSVQVNFGSLPDACLRSIWMGFWLKNVLWTIVILQTALAKEVHGMFGPTYGGILRSMNSLITFVLTITSAYRLARNRARFRIRNFKEFLAGTFPYILTHGCLIIIATSWLIAGTLGSLFQIYLCQLLLRLKPHMSCSSLITKIATIFLESLVAFVSFVLQIWATSACKELTILKMYRVTVAQSTFQSVRNSRLSIRPDRPFFPMKTAKWRSLEAEMRQNYSLFTICTANFVNFCIFLVVHYIFLDFSFVFPLFDLLLCTTFCGVYLVDFKKSTVQLLKRMISREASREVEDSGGGGPSTRERRIAPRHGRVSFAQDIPRDTNHLSVNANVSIREFSPFPLDTVSRANSVHPGFRDRDLHHLNPAELETSFTDHSLVANVGQKHLVSYMLQAIINPVFTSQPPSAPKRTRKLQANIDTARERLSKAPSRQPSSVEDEPAASRIQIVVTADVHKTEDRMSKLCWQTTETTPLQTPGSSQSTLHSPSPGPGGVKRRPSLKRCKALCKTISFASSVDEQQNQE